MPRDTKPPAFMFYVDDFASDGKVEAMTTEGVGCYILLLCKAWRETPPGTIPDDDRLLARWARVSDQRWSELRREVLLPWEPSSEGRLVQKRLSAEFRKQRERANSRSRSGKAGAEARWQTHGERIAKESESEDENALPKEEIDFEKFWSVYPRLRRKSKGKARDAWQKATHKTKPEVLIAAAAEYAKTPEGRGKYVKMPATWLNGECWDDDREAWRADLDNPKHQSTIVTAEDKQLRRQATQNVLSEMQVAAAQRDKELASGTAKSLAEIQAERGSPLAKRKA
jgi:uncharacterized protein YdaU (DUF1376 family)